MPARVRERLEQHFAAHNAALADWLGRDLSAWSSPALARTAGGADEPGE
jgi:hypothetical protein